MLKRDRLANGNCRSSVVTLNLNQQRLTYVNLETITEQGSALHH